MGVRCSRELLPTNPQHTQSCTAAHGAAKMRAAPGLSLMKFHANRTPNSRCRKGLGKGGYLLIQVQSRIHRNDRYRLIGNQASYQEVLVKVYPDYSSSGQTGALVSTQSIGERQ